MPDLFVCNTCNTVDSIGIAHGGILPQDPTKQQCTQCAIGEWHGYFSRAPYNSTTDLVANRSTGVGLE